MPKPKFVSVNGIKTRYFEEGEGEPLVLVHGGQYGDASSAYEWNLNMPGLAKNFHVFALDRLGQGYTDHPKSDDQYLASSSIKHLHDFMETLHIQDANVVGHSRGGFIAGRLALEYPDMVKTLIPVDSGSLAPDDPPRVGDFYTDLERKAAQMEMKEGIRLKAGANSYSKDHITEDWIDDQYQAALLPKNVEYWKRMSGVVYQKRMPDMSRMRPETLELLKAGHWKKPTLLLWGFNDPSALVDRGINLFRIIAVHAPRAQMHIFNQAGHYCYREHPGDFNDVLTSFVKHS